MNALICTDSSQGQCIRIMKDSSEGCSRLRWIHRALQAKLRLFASRSSTQFWYRKQVERLMWRPESARRLSTNPKP